MKARRRRTIRARDVTTDHKIFIERDKETVRRNICEVYKNRKLVKITYREPYPHVHFVTLNKGPMHKVEVL